MHHVIVIVIVIADHGRDGFGGFPVVIRPPPQYRRRSRGGRPLLALTTNARTPAYTLTTTYTYTVNQPSRCCFIPCHLFGGAVLSPRDRTLLLLREHRYAI